MRDLETVDADLRLVARAWRAARHMSGCTPSTAQIDELLDERRELTDAATTHRGQFSQFPMCVSAEAFTLPSPNRATSPNTSVTKRGGLRA
jgi:hypothetical protein